MYFLCSNVWKIMNSLVLSAIAHVTVTVLVVYGNVLVSCKKKINHSSTYYDSTYYDKTKENLVSDDTTLN